MKKPARGKRNTQRGVALLLVLTWIALMVALVGQFTYGTNVDAAQAANARDELRAHYLAVSAVNLARMLIKIQKQFVDPVMSQAQNLIKQFTGGSGTGGASGGGAGGSSGGGSGFGFSLRVTDYAGPLMGFFSGSKEEVAGLGSLVGIDTSGVKGLGLKSGTFDAEITAEDAKININCGGSFQAQANNQKMLFRLLMGLMYSRRFDRLFSESDSNGQFATRADVARAIIDWVDFDEAGFSPDGVSASGEDYRYDDRADKYRAHNGAFDSLEELKLVRGVTDGFMEAFQPYLTVYPFPGQAGGAASSAQGAACKVNLSAITNKNGGDCTPLLMGVLRAAAIPDQTKPPADPSILDDTRLYPVASVLCDRASAGGFDSLQAITAILQSPAAAVTPDDPRYKILQSLPPINVGNLGDVAVMGPPRIYRVVAVGEAGKVKKKITAIVDTQGVLSNPLTLNAQAEQAAGILRYWREE
jgi:general secretion pathway protein K